MISIVVTPNALQDLEELWDADEDAAAEIETALDEIGNNPDLLDRLTQRKFRNLTNPAYDVDVFQQLWVKGLNLYRLKFWDYLGAQVPYRVLYAHDPKKNKFYALAVIKRDHAYDIEHPIVKRVCSDYDSLGIPTYK